MNSGEKVRLQYFYGDNETVIGFLNGSVNSDLYGFSYIVTDENGEDWEVPIEDLFQGFAKIENIKEETNESTNSNADADADADELSESAC